jgi:hypothetical protein
MTSMVLMNSTLESLTPSVNTPLYIHTYHIFSSVKFGRVLLYPFVKVKENKHELRRNELYLFRVCRRLCHGQPIGLINLFLDQYGGGQEVIQGLQLSTCFGHFSAFTIWLVCIPLYFIGV